MILCVKHVSNKRPAGQVRPVTQSCRNYDIVQLINPVFFDVKAARLLPVYNYLKRNNGKVFLGAFGVDTFWINTCLDGKTFRYSDFDLFGKRRDNY